MNFENLGFGSVWFYLSDFLQFMNTPMGRVGGRGLGESLGCEVGKGTFGILIFFISLILILLD